MASERSGNPNSVNTLGLDSILEHDPGLPGLPGFRDDQEIGVCFTRPKSSLTFNPEPWQPWLPSSAIRNTITYVGPGWLRNGRSPSLACILVTL